MQSYKLFVDGKYTDAGSGQSGKSANPATGEAYATVQLADKGDAERAVASAHAAFAEWKEVPPSQREALLLKAADVIEARAAELEDVLVDEAGSTIAKAKYETASAPVFLRGMAGECRRVTGTTYSSDYTGAQSYSIRRPLGVIVAIAPFNFPLLLGIRKIGWALAAGNSVVLKPSEVTPVIGLKIGEIFAEAGFPPGVLNVLPGDGAVLGDSLIADPRVKKVTFTGSTEVGRVIAAKCGEHLKTATLELGGKNPLVILDDADIEYAVANGGFQQLHAPGASLHDRFARNRRGRHLRCFLPEV